MRKIKRKTPSELMSEWDFPFQAFKALIDNSRHECRFIYREHEKIQGRLIIKKQKGNITKYKERFWIKYRHQQICIIRGASKLQFHSGNNKCSMLNLTDILRKENETSQPSCDIVTVCIQILIPVS